MKGCDEFTKKDPKFNLQEVWDDCVVEELAAGRDLHTLGKDLLGDIKSYKGRPEVGHASRHAWLAWGTEPHALAVSVAFDRLQELTGIRLAFLLDQNFGKQ
jgi:hypothetical protein